MDIASLIVAAFDYFKEKSKEKEEFKHALNDKENCQLFENFVSRADGNIKLFKSTLDAFNYCNESLASSQYFTDKEKELSEHPEWFEKTLKAFVIRNSLYKKYKKIILDAISEYDKDCENLDKQMVENAIRNPGKISITV